MTTTETNILKYIIEDKTQSAIFLTGPWGVGKSYFINNKLVPFLKEKERKCIVVSLYGLKNIYEISKSIFFGQKKKKKRKKSTTLESAKIVASTVFKNFTSYFDIDLSLSDRQLQKLYESMDFSKTLIVLEDLERTSIDINEIMGFVSRLVEFDKAKIMLVANEDELIKVLGIHKDKYLSSREKVVGDTIYFDYKNEEGIKGVIKEFNSPLLNLILSQKTSITSDILNEIMSDEKINSFNLRALKYACQKTINLFGNNYKDFDIDYLTDVFLGNIAFCLRRSKGEKIDWKGNELTSTEFGVVKHPLYRVGYSFIEKQSLSNELISASYNSYMEANKKNRASQKIKDNLYVIYHFDESSEVKLNNSLSIILEEINKNHLPLSEYLKLGAYLIVIKECISEYGYYADQIKNALITSLEKRKDVSTQLILVDGIEFKNNEAKEEYELFAQTANKVVLSKIKAFDFDYSAKSLANLETQVCEKHNAAEDVTFINKFDLNKLLNLIASCNAEELATIRRIFHVVYGTQDEVNSLYMDFEALNNLKNGVRNIVVTYRGDKIVRFQLNNFVDDLDKYLHMLNASNRSDK